MHRLITVRISLFAILLGGLLFAGCRKEQSAALPPTAVDISFNVNNPAYVDRRRVGATPPNIYDLKPREKLFHGVAALRMTPVGENEMHGRTGLLVHSYLLGPNGDSNGCVSSSSVPRCVGTRRGWGASRKCSSRARASATPR